MCLTLGHQVTFELYSKFVYHYIKKVHERAVISCSKHLEQVRSCRSITYKFFLLQECLIGYVNMGVFGNNLMLALVQPGNLLILKTK